MPAKLIDGKQIAKNLRLSLKDKVDASIANGNRKPGLAVILVGNNPASEVYVRNKRKACEEIGIESFPFDLPDTTTQEELEKIIEKCNQDERIDGILVQFPLPDGLDESKISAGFENGILTVTLPKMPEEQPRKIEVKINK